MSNMFCRKHDKHFCASSHLTPVFSLMLEQSSEMSVPLSVKSVTSVMPLMLLASSVVQSWERLSCWYCRAGSWIAWMSKLESTNFPTLNTQMNLWLSTNSLKPGTKGALNMKSSVLSDYQGSLSIQ